MNEAAPAGLMSRLRQSRFWNGPLQRLAERTPPGLRAPLRRIAKAVYWTLTPHRTAARIAFLKHRRALAAAYAGEAVPRRPIDLAKARAEFRATRAKEFARFLRGRGRLALPSSEAPAVSVILILHNQAELTFHCLTSLVRAEVPTEVVILDNGSTDRTGDLLDRIDGARIIRSPENLHFLRGVNRAAQEARGEALLLLNNDTWVEPGSIRAAWERLHAEPDVGAVGGRIILPNETLQEAGSIIWSDGSCVSYGRGRDPDDPEFAFRRDVDYCSGAFLMVRRADFEALGGLDTAYAPAYYEETDLCMRLRAVGKRVVYEPAVRLIHFEFGSTSSEAALALQARNHALFRERHAEALRDAHHPPGAPPVIARARGDWTGRIFIMDDRTPDRSLGSGLGRAADLLRAVRAAGWFVTFYPVQSEALAPDEVVEDGLEILAGPGVLGLPSVLAGRSGGYDVVLISRPHHMETFRRALRAAPDFLRGARLIYDAEALFHGRAVLKRAVRGEPADPAADARELAEELGLVEGVQTVLSVSEAEAATFRTACADVRVLGHAIAPDPTPAGFDQRAGLLFVGALQDDETPNADSLVWFVNDVMPRLDSLIGDGWTLTIAGRCTAPSVQALAGPRVRLLGRVDDLAPLYGSARALIAPTRFAAGIPMKVHEAAGAGLPVAATELIAGQLGWTHGEEIMAGSTPEAFAEACRVLMTDSEAWRRVREGALAAVARDCDPQAFEAVVREVLAGPGKAAPRARAAARRKA